MTDCVLSFSVCWTDCDVDVFVAGGFAVLVVLAVCCFTSAEESKHKILLCLGTFAASCWLVFSADKG